MDPSAARFMGVWIGHLVDLLAGLFLLTFLVLFVMQFPHPSGLDDLGLVQTMQTAGTPILSGIASALGLSWPAPSLFSASGVLPLLLCAAIVAVRAMIHTRLDNMIEDAAREERLQSQRALMAARAASVPRSKPKVRETLKKIDELEYARAPDFWLDAPEEVPLSKFLEGAAPETPAEPAAKSQPTTAPEEDKTLQRPAGASGAGPGMAGAGPAALPTRIGRYQIEAELGRGGMGVVYRALDPHIGRTVAIKAILASQLNEYDLKLYKARFQREAQAAGRMAHPGIVYVHDVGEDEQGQPMMVMEFVEGETLENILKGGRLPVDQALDIVVKVAQALDYAHTKGVVHRDVKPANIIITPGGQPKITDFGIAKMAGTRLTQTGMMVGTPAFMSPEQFTGNTVDSRSDIFSLGSILYDLVTGEKPFPGETLTVIAYKVVQTDPVPARVFNPALSPDIDVILSRCLAKRPDARYATAGHFASDLEACRTGKPIAPHPTGNA